MKTKRFAALVVVFLGINLLLAGSLSAKDEWVNVRSKNFNLIGGDAEIGCAAKVAATLAVLTYRPKAVAKSSSRGELLSIEFVPAHFRFVDPDAGSAAVVETTESPEQTLPATEPSQPATGESSKDDFEAERRNAMMVHIKESIRKPGTGERQEMAFIEKSECSNKGMFFYFKTATQVLKLSNPAADKLAMRAFTPDVENLQIGCGMKAVEIPVVITYTEKQDKKSKANGELIALEFVPKSFVLQ